MKIIWKVILINLFVFGCNSNSNINHTSYKSVEINKEIQEFREETIMNNGNADVIYVKAFQNNDESWNFQVTVSHLDTGWDDYADGWDVFLEDGTILKPDPSSNFTRLLLHPHENEQPFTRNQNNIQIPKQIDKVFVRAHDSVDGFGGKEVTVDLTVEFDEFFEVKRNN